ncbi:hypothetical protein SPRG_01663 [Saprolegnia parasitica CBS 223.65]|uniref:5-azacytidine-induced protein 1 n=1 Tax=Saprolegnia parasitica (strain CBS 223.65) TaxID=695850 RepID=A0A067CSX0_SAPPC|nr:hypothetical protein SPRG_01663 [Saprolegnia parasitica CBS 223.65]KDO33784.1 hypothetical protein SPRG_01663 [Saprolegnia parasitica CBS 223.65]|eukprot:XP_012195420.1 hypothetical protein SPRG_01663 [Saprolegnia parasitica CBS 223.65]
MDDDGYGNNHAETTLDELVLDDPATTPPPHYSTAPDSKHSIYDFLDEVEVKSVQQLQRTPLSSSSPLLSNHRGPPFSSSSSGRSSNDSNVYYNDIKEKLVTLNMELQDKTQTIALLQAARRTDKAKYTAKLDAADAKFKTLLKEQQVLAEKDIEKHLDFEQTLVADKSELAAKCEALATELRKLETRLASETAGFERHMKDAKDRWAATEKTRRDQWMAKKTDEIKKSTIKALEPDVQAIMTKCRETIQKAQDAAAEEKRKLQLQFEKEKDEYMRRERDATDKKLIEAREKERSKLMFRLDAADAELQQQLSAQRRRLQEEAEKARDEMVAEVRQLKLVHAKELDETRAMERQRIEYDVLQLQREKDEMAKRYDADAAHLRDKYQADLDAMQKSMHATLRSEFELEKRRLEQEMVAARDAKIELILDKLQAETQRKVEAAEKRLMLQFETETKEYEKKLRAATDMEVAWMDKNRDLFDKCAKLESDRDTLKTKFHEQATGLQTAHERIARLQHLLDEERGRFSQDEAHRAHQLGQARDAAEAERQRLSAVVDDLHAKLDAVESKYGRQLQDLKTNHDDLLEKLHTRVRATVAKKDEMIDALRDELHLAQVRLTKCEAIINDQRAQLIR